MADFSALKTAIQNAIKQNGNEEITGNILQDVLLAIVTTLGDGSIDDLITSLGSEATTRGNADTTLQQNIDAEAQARSNADTALSNRLGSTITAENTAADQIGAEAEAREAADTALQGFIDGITENIENGYVYAGIATPSSTPASGKVFYLALSAGTYTNFGNTAVTQGINILKYNGSAWSLDAFVGIDDTPTPSSNNLVKSGGAFDFVMKNGSAFDLTAYNNGTTYADLNAALTALNALPAAYKKGGMSMKFVHTSDNNYVQARFMLSGSFTTAQFTNIDNWQGVDNEPTAGSMNLVESSGVVQECDVIKLKCDAIQFSEDKYWGKYCSNTTTGEISPATDTRNAYIVGVEANKQYYITLNPFHSGYEFYSGIPSRETFIGLVNKNANDIVTVPNNSKYMVITINTSSSYEHQGVMYSVDGAIEQNKSLLNKIASVANETSSILYTEIGSISLTTGALLPDAKKCRTIGFLEAPSVVEIKDGYVFHSVLIYNRDGTYVSHSSESSNIVTFTSDNYIYKVVIKKNDDGEFTNDENPIKEYKSKTIIELNSKIGEAPNDGGKYVRQNKSWVSISEEGSGVDIPLSWQYGRIFVTGIDTSGGSTYSYTSFEAHRGDRLHITAGEIPQSIVIFLSCKVEQEFIPIVAGNQTIDNRDIILPHTGTYYINTTTGRIGQITEHELYSHIPTSAEILTRTNFYGISFWGSSTMAANWVKTVANTLNMPFYWGGVGGETMWAIAGRMGAVPLLTQNSMTIAGEAGSLTELVNGLSFNCKYNGETKQVGLMAKSTGLYLQSLVNPCYIAGIKGNIIKTNNKWYFERESAGASVTVPDNEPIITFGAGNTRDTVWCLACHFNSTSETAETITSVYKRLYDYSQSKRILILGAHNTNSNGYGSGSDKSYLIAVENSLFNAFGAMFFNTREYMTTYGWELYKQMYPNDWSEIDQTYADNGVPPECLYEDGTHFNAKGYEILTIGVVQRLKALGYNLYREGGDMEHPLY